MRKVSRWIFVTAALVVYTMMIGTGAASSTITVAVEPQEVKDVNPGESFTVSITVTDVVITDTPPIIHGLHGWSVKMTFNPDILNCTSFEEGPFLEQVDEETIPLRNINNSAGFAFIGGMFNLPLPEQGATGSGVLGTVTFKVKGRGETPLRLETLALCTFVAGESAPIENVLAADGKFSNTGASILSIELIIAIIVPVAIGGSIAVFLYRRRTLTKT